MIDAALIGIIRRWHIRDQIPLREISRLLGISGNTVRRYLRSEVTDPACVERQTTSAIDKYAMLRADVKLKKVVSIDAAQKASLGSERTRF